MCYRIVIQHNGCGHEVHAPELNKCQRAHEYPFRFCANVKQNIHEFDTRGNRLCDLCKGGLKRSIQLLFARIEVVEEVAQKAREAAEEAVEKVAEGRREPGRGLIK